MISYSNFLNEGYREFSAAVGFKDESNKYDQGSKGYHKFRALHHLNMMKHHKHLSDIHMEQRSIEGSIQHKNIADAHEKRYQHHKQQFLNWSDELAGNI